jgi:hypothetical protein
MAAMLGALMGVSLMGAAFALLVHVASFSMAVNSNLLHVTLFAGAFVLFAGAMFSFPRSEMEVEGSTVSLKPSIWTYVPWWLYAPAIALAIYGSLGLHEQVPGVDEFSVIDMSPVIARWACIFEGAFFQVAAALYCGAGRIRGELG